MSHDRFELTTDHLVRLQQNPRFQALVTAGVNVNDLVHLDPLLVRDPRLLVPVDVIAFVVPQGGDEPMVRLPFRGADDPPPDPVDPGTAREPGVHLLWSTPSALGRGTLVDDPSAPGDQSKRRLRLPPLPDRWVVVRMLALAGGTLVTSGWVVEADTATITPLADWPASLTRSQTYGPSVDAERLTTQSGGPNWTLCYDAAMGRLALHDDLADLRQSPPTLAGDAISYLVCGWWSDPAHDPLAGVDRQSAFHQRLQQLRWNDPDHPAPANLWRSEAAADVAVERRTGVPTGRQTRTTKGVWAATVQGSAGAFAERAPQVNVLASTYPRVTLLHGVVHGVPLRGVPRPEYDARPDPAATGLVLGPSTMQAAAALATGGGVGTEAAERIVTAIRAGLAARLGDPDVLTQLADATHRAGFGSGPAGTEAVDVTAEQTSGLADPGSANRATRRAGAVKKDVLQINQQIVWSMAKLYASEPVASSSGRTKQQAKPVAAPPAGRSTPRPATAFTHPGAPVVAITGAGRALDPVERDEADGTLTVRRSTDVQKRLGDRIELAGVLTSLGSGAIPPETVLLAREALAQNPHWTDWLAERLARGAGNPELTSAATARLRAEGAVLYAHYCGDVARVAKAVGIEATSATSRQQLTEGLLRHALIDGVLMHPMAVCLWGQPWRPQFCEWTCEVDLVDLAAELAGTSPDGAAPWQLGETDLTRDGDWTAADTVTVTGRSVLHPTLAQGLAEGIASWADDERARDKANRGQADPATEQVLADASSRLRRLDVLSASLDGIRHTLVGVAYDRGETHVSGGSDDAKAIAVALPRLVAAGRVRLTSARVVDSFGRLLPLDLTRAVLPAGSSDTQGRPVASPALVLPARVTTPARVNLRLVDAPVTAAEATAACVNQLDLSAQVNPVSGFLLPDHIDEALEMFATDGTPLGQLFHDGFSNGVVWEGAPGRTDIGPAAGPLDDPDPAHQRLGWIASGLVVADATLRTSQPDRAERESPLSALLRAVDTTLWTVDPLGSMGTEHIAGLVGRPIAVVNARLTLDVPSDVADLSFADPQARAARERAFAELASVPFPVRLGSVSRGDDGLLGYFVDDDYSHFHVVDRAVAELALASGRSQGQLGLTGTAATDPITSTYLDTSSTITLRAGQVRRLTLLMHPGGRVHVTSGIAPRSHVALFRDWVEPGLRVMAPSVRVGPLLIDADKVRLPKVSSFPADQVFTRRTSPSSWRDDPIVSATQFAFLPDQPSTFAEGWIRVNPHPEASS